MRGMRSTSRSIFTLSPMEMTPPAMFTGRTFFMQLTALLRLRRAFSRVLSDHRYSHILSFDMLFSSTSMSARICAFLNVKIYGVPSTKSSGLPSSRALYFILSRLYLHYADILRFNQIHRHLLTKPRDKKSAKNAVCRPRGNSVVKILFWIFCTSFVTRC